MNTFFRAFLLLIVTSTCASAQTPKAVHLATEYLENPIGIDAATPRFSWYMDDKREGAKQTAYRIVVGMDSVAVATGKGDVWDSDWTPSGNSRVVFAGKKLTPFTRYFWTVAIADQSNTRVPASSVSSFETGMMEQTNWKGAWISDGIDVDLKPAPYFRKVFEPSSKKIRSARAYIAVGGLYELYINGKKIGNHRLDPTYTRFDRRTLYVTHDVTRALQDGTNAIGVMLGNGWYNHQSTAVWNFHKAPWRNRPAFCLDLRIVYEDGTTQTITSGKEWKTSLSPVVFNSIYTAEHHDARLEQSGWNTSRFDDTKWKQVIFRAAPSMNIVAQAMHPVRNVEAIVAKSMKKFNDTTFVFDLGRNISGVSELRVKGASGTVVRLKHGERLYKDGHVDISNIDVHYRPTDTLDPFQSDIITLGADEYSFMPHFNYKGFQYVEVTSSAPVNLTTQSLTGYFMHSDIPTVGQIRSSNPVLDKILFATNSAYLSNLFGYPTDCPQREKNGWTGDAAIAIETGLYSFDGITVYEKWLADHRDEQQPNGILPSIIPTSGWGYEWGNGPDWTSTIAIIPWNLYLFYGDTKPLADNYENIKRYVNYIESISPTGLTTWGLGDWIPVKSKSPVELTSTCYYYADAIILSKAAALLGKEDDRMKYATLADKIKDAFNAKYFHKEKAIYNEGLQTELSVPLFWGLVPEESKSAVAKNLAMRVAADNFHLDVGLLGQKAILNALSDNGYADVAYRLASQETYPSWGWWIKNGATTLYENWNIDAANDVSLNHIMFGEIGAWLYKGLGGIKPDPSNPGFKNVLVRPYFPEQLKSFEATHVSPYGEIRSSWVREGKKIIYRVTVPPNSTAMVTLPDMKSVTLNKKKLSARAGDIPLSAGTYEFELR